MSKENKQYPTFVDFRKGEEDKAPFGVVIGYATRDAELRETNSGKSVANFGIALNLAAKQINYLLGTKFNEDEVIFVEATAWEKTADILNKANVTKGSQVAVTGTLALEEYEGNPRVRLNISRFQILRRKGQSQGDDGEVISDDDLPF